MTNNVTLNNRYEKTKVYDEEGNFEYAYYDNETFKEYPFNDERYDDWLLQKLNEYDKQLKYAKFHLKRERTARMSLDNTMFAIQKWGVKAPCFLSDGSYNDEYLFKELDPSFRVAYDKENDSIKIYSKDENKLLSLKDTVYYLNLYVNKSNSLKEENDELKQDDLIFFQNVFDILMKYQHLFNREMADEVLEKLGIELTDWYI